METTATDVPHIAELNALVTVNWCWFPEVLVISEREGHRIEGESSPQSISVVKQAHLPRRRRLASRKALGYIGRLTAYISSIPLAWNPWWDLEGWRGKWEASEQPNGSECGWFIAPVWGCPSTEITVVRTDVNQAPPRSCDHEQALETLVTGCSRVLDRIWHVWRVLDIEDGAEASRIVATVFASATVQPHISAWTVSNSIVSSAKYGRLCRGLSLRRKWTPGIRNRISGIYRSIVGAIPDLGYCIDHGWDLAQTEASGVYRAQRHYPLCDGSLKGVTISEVSLAIDLSRGESGESSTQHRLRPKTVRCLCRMFLPTPCPLDVLGPMHPGSDVSAAPHWTSSRCPVL